MILCLLFMISFCSLSSNLLTMKSANCPSAKVFTIHLTWYTEVPIVHTNVLHWNIFFDIMKITANIGLSFCKFNDIFNTQYINQRNYSDLCLKSFDMLFRHQNMLTHTFFLPWIKSLMNAWFHCSISGSKIFPLMHRRL